MVLYGTLCILGCGTAEIFFCSGHLHNYAYITHIIVSGQYTYTDLKSVKVRVTAIMQ